MSGWEPRSDIEQGFDPTASASVTSRTSSPSYFTDEIPIFNVMAVLIVWAVPPMLISIDMVC